MNDLFDDFDDFDAGIEPPVEQLKPKTEPKKEVYLSQDGFIEDVRIYRGLHEVQKLLAMIQDNGVICGGYVRWMCSPTSNPIPAHDVDVYPFSMEGFDEIKQFFLEMDMEIKHENNMSITYKLLENPEHSFFGCPPIQLIKPVVQGRVVSVGSIEEILANFDFSVVRAAIGYENQKFQVVVDADYLHDETFRILRLKNIHCPVSSILRCMKYSRKGYFLPPTETLKILYDWDSRTPEYKQKLIEFLRTANNGEGLTQKQVDELEEMMRID